MSEDSAQLNPTALTAEQVARVLSAAGPKPVTPEMIPPRYRRRRADERRWHDQSRSLRRLARKGGEPW